LMILSFLTVLTTSTSITIIMLYTSMGLFSTKKQQSNVNTQRNNIKNQHSIQWKELDISENKQLIKIWSGNRT